MSGGAFIYMCYRLDHRCGLAERDGSTIRRKMAGSSGTVRPVRADTATTNPDTVYSAQINRYLFYIVSILLFFYSSRF